MITFEVKKIWEDAKKRVTVSCDEMHPHTAIRGCLHGDPRDVNICKLCEEITRDRRLIYEAVAHYTTEVDDDEELGDDSDD